MAIINKKITKEMLKAHGSGENDNQVIMIISAEKNKSEFVYYITMEWLCSCGNYMKLYSRISGGVTAAVCGNCNKNVFTITIGEEKDVEEKNIIQGSKAGES